jgi:hypothetical protein
MRKKTIKTDGRKLLLDALKLIGIGGRNRIKKTIEAYYNLDLTKVKYSTYEHSREENL